MCICGYVKNRIGTCNVFFGLKKGISELLHWVAPKHTAENMSLSVVVIAREHVGTQSTQDTLVPEHTYMEDTLAREHISTQGTLAREHLSIKGTLAREHVSIQGTLTREHISTQGTLPCEHVRHTI